jgi:hypothetical protein
MPRQLSDEEYNFLQSRRMTADFVESIYNDPQLNKEAKRLIKKKYPNLAIPDLDIEDRVQAQLNAERDHRAAKEAEEKRKADDAKWRAERERVQKQYSFTDDGMRELEGWMTDKGVGDYEVAAGYRAAKNPRASEPTYDSQFWHHDRTPDFKEIAKDPEAWGRREILGAIQRDQERERGAR